MKQELEELLKEQAMLKAMEASYGDVYKKHNEKVGEFMMKYAGVKKDDRFTILDILSKLKV